MKKGMKKVYPGIRKRPNGTFLATKSIDGQRYYRQFNNANEALYWKNNFHPLLNKSPKTNYLPSEVTPRRKTFSNGSDPDITLGEVYESYLRGPFNMLGEYGKKSVKGRLDRFLPQLLSVKISDINPEAITTLLEEQKLMADFTYGRTSFREELKYFKVVLNWYKAEKDFTFNIPITSYHYKIADIRPKEVKEKNLSVEEVERFIGNLEGTYKILATIQFLYAMRIGEVCALTTDTVDFKRKIITIRQSITWLKDIPKLKHSTKTEVISQVGMTDSVVEMFRELDLQRPKGCKFFFHNKGELPRYRYIVTAYNEALLKAGITNVTGTHFLRHSMATLTRKLGGIDAAQAILRHKSSAMAEHYARLDVDDKVSEVVIHAEKLFEKAATRASNASKKA